MPEPEPIPPHIPDVGVPAPPVPLPEAAAVRVKTVYWAPSTYLRGHLTVHGLAFLTIAASMYLQPERYTFRTNRGLLYLLSLLTPREWATVFAIIGVIKLLACLVYPRWARWVVLGGMLLLSWWAAGFAVAWLFGQSTILGLVAWALLVGEHFAALTLIDGRRTWRDYNR